MKEFIPFTKEHDTTEERFAWDSILRTLATLSEFDNDLDIYEAINDLRDEELEDGLMMVFNYAVLVTVPEYQSSELERTLELLEKHGIIVKEGDSDEV